MAQTTKQEIKYVRPWLAPYQEESIFCKERFSLVEGSTKCGKTAPAILRLFESALQGKVGQNFWWVAPVSAQAEIAYKRMKRQATAIDQNGRVIMPFKPNESKKILYLPNGTEMHFKSADKPDSLYGEDVFDMIADEASRMKDAAQEALLSTLTASMGRFLGIGNVRGRNNWHYKMSRQAEGGAADMRYTKINCYDAITAGVLTQRAIDDAKRMLPDHVFRELYLAEPSDDGGNPFGLEAIRQCIVGTDDLAANDNYLIWENGNPVDAWGWDLAKSVDYTVGAGMDKQGNVNAVVRFQANWEETESRIINHTSNKPALVDSTGVGDPILERLQKNSSNFEGLKFTQSSKQQLMEGLALDIQQRNISYPNGIIVLELEQFEYELTRTGVRYSAPEPLHDDCVCALGLANKHRKAEQPFFYVG